MNALLDKILDAHGGIDRWRRYTEVRASIVAATTATLLILRHKAKSASSLFAASLSELSKDHSELGHARRRD